MNERVKALLLNARNMFVNGVTESDNKIYIHGSEENLEKFTELIVRECAAVAYSYDPVEPVPSAIAKLIQTHFGVEEQATETVELHTCPYAEEIHGDYETLCDCDEERTRQCAMDI